MMHITMESRAKPFTTVWPICLLLLLAVALPTGALAKDRKAVETKVLDTREVVKATSHYEKAITARNQALGKLQQVSENLLKQSKSSKGKSSAASLEGLNRAIDAHLKAAAKDQKVAKTLVTENTKAVGKYIDAFYKEANKSERAAMDPAVKALQVAQIQARKSYNSALKEWQVSLRAATNAKSGGKLLIAKQSSAASSKKASKTASSTSTASSRRETEEITIQSETIQINSSIQPIIEVTILSDEEVSLSSANEATSQPSSGGIILRPGENPRPVTLVLLNEETGPTMDLFEFAEMTGNFDNIIVDTQDDGCADVIAQANSSTTGYSGLFSVVDEDTECVSTNDSVADQFCQVCFYEHVSYRGESYCTDDTSGDLRDHGMNDKVSSVKIIKDNCAGAGISLYENDNQGGWRLQLVNSSLNVGNRYNDKITSFTFAKNMAAQMDSVNGCNATLYEHAGYRGKSVQIDQTRTQIPHLKRQDMNDKTTAIRIDFSGCPGARLMVYEHDDYDGRRWAYTSSSSNIGSDRNDKITAVKLLLP